MARKFVTNYSFTPSSDTVKIAGYVSLERFLMITHIPSGIVIQQFASPELGISSHTFDSASTDLDSDSGVTTIVLDYDCVGLSSSDDLQIIIEENEITTRPFEFGTDAIERQRIANPQSLIDADFEYGIQGTKWHTFSSIRNIPGIYELPGQDLAVANAITNNTSPYSTITVTSNGHGLSVGQAITIFGLENEPPTASRAEGGFLVFSVPTTNTFTYIAKGYVGPATSTVLSTPYTQLRKANFYQNAIIPFTSVASNGANPSTITVTTANTHGLSPGHTLSISVSSSGNNLPYAEGNFFVLSTPTPTTFTYQALTGGAVGTGLSNAVMNVYSRNDSFNIHRPFDGGVLIGPNAPTHGASVLRQSKKYFRYQSGKGILWTSGTLYHPNYDVEAVSSSGNTIGSAITVTTEQSHGLQAGATVILTGVSTNGYNGTYTVQSIVSETGFTVTAANTLAQVGANSGTLEARPRIAVSGWHGSSIRAGLFDEQNGLFWESDGQRISVVKRSSTFQLAGTATVTNGSVAVTGTNTRWYEQLAEGDKIVIRGQSYEVTNVANNTAMQVSPFVILNTSSATGVKITKTIEERVPQEDFNKDRIDGTGPSGYNFNLNKMQMTGIQYSWYGAGFADFIIRGLNGNFVFAHRFKNNNINDEAYMRSGNLPARYEIVNKAPRTYLTAAANTTQNYLTAGNTYFFPTTGTLLLGNEMISYSGKSNANNTFTGCSRAASLTQFVGGSNRTFSAGVANDHASSTGVQLVSCTCAPTLSHWGSSIIMDGNFDLDRGYFFNYARTNLSVTAGSTATAFLIRLAPTVSNSIPGNLGQRELINRSQILLEKLELISTQNMQVTGLINPANTSSVTWSNLNTSALGSQPSFTQVSQTFTGIAAPGEQILSTIVSSAGGLTYVDLKALKEIGNGVIGGGNQYPDGPEVLAINVKNLGGSTATVQLNLFWSETQA